MLALLPLALLSAGLVLDGSVRGEARDGATVAGQDPRAGVLAVDLNGRTSGPDAALLFGILPSAVFAHDNQFFARGYLELDLRMGGNGTLRLRQRGGYGTVDLSPVGLAPSVQPGTSPDVSLNLPPGSRFVFVQESSSALELEMQATRRLRVLASGSWNVSGGADHDAGLALPLSRGPQARASLEWAATRLDFLRLETSGFDTRYGNGNRASVANVTGGWRTLPSRWAELSFAAGAGVGRASVVPPGGSAPTVSILPYALGSADLRVTGLRDFSAGLGGALEPAGDPLNGDLVERGTVRALAVWGAPGRLSLSAHLAGSIAVTSGNLGPLNGTQSGDKFAQGDLTLSVPVTRRSALDIGARGSWLSRPLQNQPDRQWIAFVGYSAQLPLIR